MLGISIILPTRGRPEKCQVAVESLYSTCADESNFEVLIGVDKDDETTPELRWYLEKYSNLSLHIFETRHGYVGFHKYVNHLSFMAKGTYLFLFNDDTMVTSRGWDSVILSYKDTFTLINPLVRNMEGYCRTNYQVLFPIIPSKWLEVTGRWANNAACDTWVQDIGRSLGITSNEDNIVIIHNRPDVSSTQPDQTSLEVEAIRPSIKEDFYSIERQSELSQDYNKLQTYLNR